MSGFGQEVPGLVKGPHGGEHGAGELQGGSLRARPCFRLLTALPAEMKWHEAVKACVCRGFVYPHSAQTSCYSLHMARLLWGYGFSLLGPQGDLPWKVALRPWAPNHPGGTSGCQRGGQKSSSAGFPGGVQTDAACRHLHGPAVVPSVLGSLNSCWLVKQRACGAS